MEEEEEEVLEISLDRLEKPVRIKDKGGTPVTYTMCEMDGAGRSAYMNFVSGRMKIVGQDAQGKPISKVKDFAGLQANLISRCLVDQNGERVSEATIEAWPSTAQNLLFKMAQEMNGLGEEKEKADDEEGND